MFDKNNADNPLPVGFLFGVATADHQCEAYNHQYEDIQDLWEQARNLTKRQSATDFWNRYQEDIGLAHNMGCNAFRFSLAWSRLEPSPGVFNDEAFDHYRNLILTMRARGIEPVCTLHHYTWPVHIEKSGGSVSPDFPARFAAYASEVCKRLGDLVTYWVTFNEPNQLVYGYFNTGGYKLPPGLPKGASHKEQIEKVRTIIPNIFKAHKAARDILKQHYPLAKVGANPFLFGFPRFFRWFVDWQACRLNEASMEKKAFRPTEHSSWSTDVDIVVAMLSVTPERKEKVDFSDVYYVDGMRLLTSVANKINSVSDLVNKKIGIIKGSAAEVSFNQLFPSSADQPFADLKSALQALDSNTVSAILNDESLLEITATGNPVKYHFVGERVTEEHYAVGVPKGNALLLDAVNLAVENFLESEKNESSTMYSGYADLATIPSDSFDNIRNQRVLAHLSSETRNLGFTDSVKKLPPAQPGSLLRKIQDRGFLKVSVKTDAPGFGYFDAQTKQYTGLEIELAKKVAQVIFGNPNQIEFHSVSAKQRMPGISSIFQVFDPILQSFSILSTIFNSNWWNLGMAGKLPEFLCPAECALQQDFVGFDYYWGVKTLLPGPLMRLAKASKGRYTAAPVWPGGLYNLLKVHSRLFPNQEIIIIENGCVITADNVTQGDYIKAHFDQVKRAISNGIKIKGYICWSITTNREWGLKLGPDSDFGLYRIDLDNDPKLTRVQSASVEVYRDIIKSNLK